MTVNYLLMLNLIWTFCSAQSHGMDVRANPPQAIRRCAVQKERCLKKAKFQKDVQACLET